MLTVEVDFFRLAAGLDGVGAEYWMAYPIPPSRWSKLEIGFGSKRSVSAAWIDANGHVERLDEVVIVGQYLERWIPGQEALDLRGRVPLNGPFSRYAGALGGDRVLNRLQAARMTVVGNAQHRTFVEMARQATRAGLRGVALCPTESSRMAASRLHLGLLRVGGMSVMNVGHGPEGHREWQAISASDIIVCIDADRFLRGLAEEAAVAHHRVLLTIDGFRRSGTLTRLFLPGSACPRCFRSIFTPQPLVDECPSSSVSAVHAFSMVEALVRGNISESVAYVLESKATEVGEVLREAIRKDIDCTLCRTAGQAGDVLATSDW